MDSQSPAKDLNEFDSWLDDQMLDLDSYHTMSIYPSDQIPIEPSELQLQLTDQLSFPEPNPDLTHQQLFDLYCALFYKLTEMVNERYHLETSLRGEVMAAEEQRVENDYMRQALSMHMEDIGAVGMDLDTFVDVANNRSELNIVREEQQRLNNIIKSQEIQLQKLVAQLDQAYKQQPITVTKTNSKLLKQNESRQREELFIMQQEKQAMEADVKRHLTSVQKLNEDMKLLRQLNESLKSQLGESIQTNGDLSNELSSTIAECNARQQEILEQEETIEACKSTIEDLMNEAAKTEHQSNQADMEALQNQLSEAVRERDQLNETLQATKLEVDSLKELNSQEKEKFSRLQSENSPNKVEKAQKWFAELQEMHQNVSDRLQHVETERSNLFQQLTTSQSELDDLSSRYQQAISQNAAIVRENIEKSTGSHEQLEEALQARRQAEDELNICKQNLADALAKLKEIEQENPQTENFNPLNSYDLRETWRKVEEIKTLDTINDLIEKIKNLELPFVMQLDRFGQTDEHPLKLVEKYFLQLNTDLEKISIDYKSNQKQEDRPRTIEPNEELTQTQHQLSGALTQTQHELSGALENIKELRSRFTEAAEEGNHWRQRSQKLNNMITQYESQISSLNRDKRDLENLLDRTRGDASSAASTFRIEDVDLQRNLQSSLSAKKFRYGISNSPESRSGAHTARSSFYETSRETSRYEIPRPWDREKYK